MMNDREFENYLALLSGMLRLRRTQQSDIAGELRDHLIEHVAELEQRGVPHQQAVREALEEFGDAAALAASFSALVRARRRRLIMRCTIGTSLVMAGLMIGAFAFRPPVENDPNLALAQPAPGETTKQAAGGIGEASTATRDLDQKTRTALKGLTELEFTEIPLKEALAYITDKHDVRFFIDERALNEASIPIDTSVTLNLNGVPVEMVLELMLHQLRLGYTVRNGLIIVSTEEALANRAEVRVYRVPEGGAEDLAQLIPATIEPHSWRYTPAGLMGGGMPGGYGGGMMPGMGSPQGAVNPVTGEGGGAMPGGAPGGVGMGGSGGLGGGGGVGSIRVFRGVLVVSQTPEVHQKIEKLLDDLDKVLPPQSGTRGASMMGGPLAPAAFETTPTGPGYPGPSRPTPRYSGSGVPQYPGQGGPPRYSGAGAPGYPQQSDTTADPAADVFDAPPDKPASGSGQPSPGAELPPPIRSEGEDVGRTPAPGESLGGGSATKELSGDGSGPVTKGLPRSPGKARN
jgi:hypothetical protein